MHTQNLPCPELVVQTAGLPEEGMDYEGVVPLTSLGIESDFRFDFSHAQLHFTLHISAVKSDVLVQGALMADGIQALCDRCAEYFPLTVETKELFHRYKQLFGEPIDLTEGLREDIVLTFPQAFLCDENCKGICPQCGTNLNQATCSCSQTSSELKAEPPEKNPWSALDQLKFPSK